MFVTEEVCGDPHSLGVLLRVSEREAREYQMNNSGSYHFVEHYRKRIGKKVYLQHIQWHFYI